MVSSVIESLAPQLGGSVAGKRVLVRSDLNVPLDGDFAKVLSWYDNEWGYSCRVVGLALQMGQ